LRNNVSQEVDIYPYIGLTLASVLIEVSTLQDTGYIIFGAQSLILELFVYYRLTGS
jgi:hypothetical protein